MPRDGVGGAIVPAFSHLCPSITSCSSPSTRRSWPVLADSCWPNWRAPPVPEWHDGRFVRFWPPRWMPTPEESTSCWHRRSWRGCHPESGAHWRCWLIRVQPDRADFFACLWAEAGGPLKAAQARRLSPVRRHDRRNVHKQKIWPFPSTPCPMTAHLQCAQRGAMRGSRTRTNRNVPLRPPCCR